MEPYHNQRKRVVIAIIAVVLALVFVIGSWKLTHKSKPETTNSSDQNTSETSSPSPKGTGDYATRNTGRRNDVALLMAAVNEFAANNSGSLPVSFDAGTLRGSSTAASPTGIGKLNFYTSVVVMSGTQSPLRSDQLTLVTGAVCGNIGEAIASSSRSFAVQYMHEEATTSLTPACENQ